jgi:pimeloyl-ACP methyl ester carboxylesterase
MTRDLIPLVQMPALLLWGECDRVIPIAWGQYVNTLSAQLTLVEVKEAGHFFYDESAADLHGLIDQWLTGELPATNENLIEALTEPIHHGL